MRKCFELIKRLYSSSMKDISNNAKRYCPKCGKKLVKNGHYANGKIRLYCSNCKKSYSVNKNATKALKLRH